MLIGHGHRCCMVTGFNSMAGSSVSVISNTEHMDTTTNAVHWKCRVEKKLNYVPVGCVLQKDMLLDDMFTVLLRCWLLKLPLLYIDYWWSETSPMLLNVLSFPFSDMWPIKDHSWALSLIGHNVTYPPPLHSCFWAWACGCSWSCCSWGHLCTSSRYLSVNGC